MKFAPSQILCCNPNQNSSPDPGTPFPWRGRSEPKCTPCQRTSWSSTPRWWWPSLPAWWVEAWRVSKEHTHAHTHFSFGYLNNILNIWVTLIKIQTVLTFTWWPSSCDITLRVGSTNYYNFMNFILIQLLVPYVQIFTTFFFWGHVKCGTKKLPQSITDFMHLLSDTSQTPPAADWSCQIEPSVWWDVSMTVIIIIISGPLDGSGTTSHHLWSGPT